MGRPRVDRDGDGVLDRYAKNLVPKPFCRRCGYGGTIAQGGGPYRISEDRWEWKCGKCGYQWYEKTATKNEGDDEYVDEEHEEQDKVLKDEDEEEEAVEPQHRIYDVLTGGGRDG